MTGVITEDPLAEAPVTSIEFRCPTCGGDSYETRWPHNTGYCLGTGDGDRNYPCKFTWARKDDYKVFVLVTRTKFGSHEAYELASKRPGR